MGQLTLVSLEEVKQQSKAHFEENFKKLNQEDLDLVEYYATPTLLFNPKTGKEYQSTHHATIWSFQIVGNEQLTQLKNKLVGLGLGHYDTQSGLSITWFDKIS